MTSTVSAQPPSDSRLSNSPPPEFPVVEFLDPEIKLPPIVQLRDYQQRWIDDPARFCLAVKSARVGYSYATTLKHILRRLERPSTTTTVLSASHAQSVEFVETAQKNVQAMGATAQLYQEPFADELGQTSFTVQRIQFPNGSRIIALSANPRTARGYPGDAVLDEFAHHENSYAIWAAILRQVALGNGVDVISTANGEQGKFFDLAKAVGLADGVAPEDNPILVDGWSAHWIDVYMAVAAGCPINIEEMRAAIRDEDTFAQEFLCIFLKSVGAWLPIELIHQAEDAGATIDWPSGYEPRGPLYAGIDVARDHDQTVLWLIERLAEIRLTRMVMPLHAMPFPQQYALLDPWVQMTQRTAIDSTGMGIALYDMLNVTNRGRVMGVNFAGSSKSREKSKQQSGRDAAGAVRMKVDLAIGLKKAMELARFRIPYDPQIRIELGSIKREATASGVTFDSPRIELETAVAGSKKRRVFAHADRFWAASLAEHAASSGPHLALGLERTGTPTTHSQTRGLM